MHGPASRTRRRRAGHGVPGPYKIRVEEKDIPVIEHPNDAIVRVTPAAVCGSDLHLYHGMLHAAAASPGRKPGRPPGRDRRRAPHPEPDELRARP
jgi:hypothetical protein